jgi:hypothetical protein
VVNPANPDIILGWISSLAGCQEGTNVSRSVVTGSDGKPVVTDRPLSEGAEPCSFSMGTDLIHWFGVQLSASMGALGRPVVPTLDLWQFIDGTATTSKLELTNAWASNLFLPQVSGPSATGLLFQGELQSDAVSLSTGTPPAPDKSGTAPVPFTGSDVAVTATGVQAIDGKAQSQTIASGVSSYWIGVDVNLTNDPATGAPSRSIGTPIFPSEEFVTPASAGTTLDGLRTFESPTKRIDPIALTLSYGDLSNANARVVIHTSSLPQYMDSFARTSDGMLHWTASSAIEVGPLN